MVPTELFCRQTKFSPKYWTIRNWLNGEKKIVLWEKYSIFLTQWKLNRKKWEFVSARIILENNWPNHLARKIHIEFGSLSISLIHHNYCYCVSTEWCYIMCETNEQLSTSRLFLCTLYTPSHRLCVWYFTNGYLQKHHRRLCIILNGLLVCNIVAPFDICANIFFSLHVTFHCCDYLKHFNTFLFDFFYWKVKLVDFGSIFRLII